ncbi:MBL fold metallo-hydrolase [Virgibacillus senegalensis]|uniref:MBL fold metallo-hydrolase n=1 Tax=Virgibacillus senegalensis TaxID=1499679 RepID=UPI00069DF6B5|nr:MBL fold metallo-hydrolase [Virgibacillus senegalensis]
MKINDYVYLVASGQMGFDWTHPSDCNVYLLESQGELALIDTGTGYSVNDICENIEKYGFSISQLKKIFLTHIHADHAGGAALLKEKTKAEVYVIESAFETLKNGDEAAIDLTIAKRFGYYPDDYQFNPCLADHLLKEGDQLCLGDFQLKVFETPGHSRFDLSFEIKSSESPKLLFSGDTVFYNGKISMLNTHDFHMQKLADSIAKLSDVEADVLLPGHYQPALKNGANHVQKAHATFQSMGIPSNIVG